MIVLSKDKEHVKAIKQALERNDGYCPCRLERTADTRCMCLEFREQKIGLCHCGLYEKI